MPTKHKAQGGQLYERAAAYAAALETGQTAAVDQLLGAWTEGYWRIRQDMDDLLAKVAAAKAAGEPLSPAWAYQQGRLKNLLATTKVEMAKYAEFASEATTKAQASAMAAALKHAEALTGLAVGEAHPTLDVSFARVNPAVLQAQVGFLTDGSPLADLLVHTMPQEAADNVQKALIQGLATGRSQDWMLRQATHALGLTHARAETILRTESLRSYRHAARSTYLANQDVLGTWVWSAHLDARTCVACAVMDGTEHPLDATLDGHPRCRCAMVPRTKTWDEITGEATGLPDTRPPIRDGKAWLAAQPPHVQRAMMGPAKFKAYTEGTITLDDLVGRTYSPAWGTMRSERSLKAILEDRNANWVDQAAPPPPVPPVGPPAAQKAAVADLVDSHDLRYLEKWAADPGDTGPQGLSNLHAAIAYLKNRQAQAGPDLPGPDLAKVDAMVAKMNAAVETKGYPSKGYSQVKAIYKAQANGTPGTQVGVVKSLTWEQKITAQAALERHNEALPSLVRAHEKAKALDAAHTEALTIHKGLNRKGQVDAAHDEALVIQGAADKAAENATKDVDTWFGQVSVTSNPVGLHDLTQKMFALRLLDAQDAIDAATDSAERLAANARWSAIEAKREAYNDAHDYVSQTWGGTSWTHPNGATGTVDTDGWFHLHQETPKFDMALPPHQAKAVLDGTSGAQPWVQVLTPDAAEVTKWLDVVLKNQDGLVTQKAYDAAKAHLATTSTMTPQQMADLTEALAKAWATEKWAPEPEYVAKIVALLDNGDTTPDLLEQSVLFAADAKPLSKANAREAIAQWQAQQAAKAITPPKPLIDPAKVKWDKVSDTQVAKLVAKVQSGSGTLDDLYAAFQASKNAGPKANYAKAILTLEGKADLIPSSLVDPQMFQTWTDDLAKGVITPEELEDLIQWEGSTQADVATAKAVLAGGKSSPAPAPPAPAVPPVKATSSTWNHTPPWKPEDLTDTGQRLGTHGAQVWTDPDGTRWLFKPPKDPKDGFLTTLDEAASRLQAMTGAKAPDTYVVTLGGKRGSIQRMFTATDGFPGGFKPTTLTDHDLAVVQKEHVLDWLLSNHDGHRDQFLRLPDGTLTAIDKGQAFRWFGQDRLDWDFHPNQAYGAPEPVYNALWREFAQGANVEIDQAALKAAIADVQAISDADLRALMRPYAEQAAARGLLAKAQKYPGLTKASIPANDVDAFLDALVARKHSLEKDFTDLYDRAAKARAQAIPGWKPKALPKPPKGKAKWVGKDSPKPPAAPTEPSAQVSHLFDTWVAQAKTTYSTFSGGKDLEASNNWARFRRVIENHDTTAVDELLARHYLTDETAAEARTLIAQAKAQQAALEAAHKVALADHATAMKRFQKDLQDWRDANGITSTLRGMDEGVIRHGTNQAGEKWAQSHFTETRYTATQKKWLKSYTGHAFSNWNDHLRATKGKPTQYLDAVKHVDNAMAAQPIPEDVILHRGTDHVLVEGGRLMSGHGDDLQGLIGNVLEDQGYGSSSVGINSAFSGKAIQMKIRAPAGTKGSYVQMFSQYGSERELILARGQRFYVHNAYKSGPQWVVEVEIVDDAFDAKTATPQPSATRWKATS